MGPFRLVSYEPGQRLTFERNPHYWRRDDAGEPPCRISTAWCSRSCPTRTPNSLRLQSGAIDMTQQHLRAEDYAHGPRAASAKGALAVLEVGVGLDPDVFFFNLRPSALGQGSARPVDATGRVPAGALACRRSRGLREHRVPRRRRAGARPGHARATRSGSGPTCRATDSTGPTAQELLQGWAWPIATPTPGSRTPPAPRPASPCSPIAATPRSNAAPRCSRRASSRSASPSTSCRWSRARWSSGCSRAASTPSSSTTRHTDTDPAMQRDFWLSSGSAHIWNIGQKSPATDWERRIDELMTAAGGAVDPGRAHAGCSATCSASSASSCRRSTSRRRALYVGVSARLRNLTPALTRPPLLWSVDTHGRGPAGGARR